MRIRLEGRDKCRAHPHSVCAGREGSGDTWASDMPPAMVGMVLSGSCERVDEIRITESVDCSTYESAANADRDGVLAGL